MRQMLVLLHRWVGLSTALFLAVAALTGSALAYKDELEAWINPSLFAVQPSSTDQALLDAFVLREKVESAFPQANVWHMSFPQPDRTSMFFLSPRKDAAGAPIEIPVDQVYVNPYSGEIVGSRKWGVLFHNGGFQRENVIPFIWRLHEALALPHPWGKVFMGLIALLWTFDCFIGVALTWPRGRPFCAKWAPAWKIKRGASVYRTNLDVHRAAGLWLWLALLVFAWSSVMLNLRGEVYQPVMSAFLSFDAGTPRYAALDEEPVVGWHRARAIGLASLREFVKQRGGAIQKEESLWLRASQGAWMYRAQTNLDVREEGGAAQAWIDARSGEVLAIRWRGGDGKDGPASGDIVSEWLNALHVAQVGGRAYQAFVALLGIVIAVLASTGVVIWWLKRKARSSAPRRRVRPT